MLHRYESVQHFSVVRADADAQEALFHAEEPAVYHVADAAVRHMTQRQRSQPLKQTFLLTFS